MQSLVRYLRSHVPLTQQIDIFPGQLTPTWFELCAPLAPNLNDKQTAFGGSMATLCTLSGWCVASYLCKTAQLEVDIAVLDSNIRYRLPVTTDPIAARTYFPSSQNGKQFIHTLKNEGKARLELVVKIKVANRVAVSFSGQYYARVLK